PCRHGRSRAGSRNRRGGSSLILCRRPSGLLFGNRAMQAWSEIGLWFATHGAVSGLAYPAWMHRASIEEVTRLDGLNNCTMLRLLASRAVNGLGLACRFDRQPASREHSTPVTVPRNAPNFPRSFSWPLPTLRCARLRGT